MVSSATSWTSSNFYTGGWRLSIPGNNSTNPTYSHANDSDTGIAFSAADTISFTTGGTSRVTVGTGGHLRPAANNAYQLGSSALRWQEIWCVQSSINSTSDEREKTDIIDSDLGLDFINELRPIRFRWKVGNRVSIPNSEYNDTENGKNKPKEIIIDRPGVRPHYAFIAQDIKKIINDKGKDFAGYCYDEENDIYSLRYGEFIAPIVKSIQELTIQLNNEKNSRIELEKRIEKLEKLLK